MNKESLIEAKELLISVLSNSKINDKQIVELNLKKEFGSSENIIEIEIEEHGLQTESINRI